MERGDNQMLFYEPYKERVQVIFQKVSQIIEGYPAHYRKHAMNIINHQNPEINGQVNYISFLLPLWIQEEFELEDDVVDQLVMANLFKVFCAGIQDKVIDGDSSGLYAELLPLSNLFFIEFYTIYQGLFVKDEAFWQALKDYFIDYSVSIGFEKKDLHEKDVDLQTMALELLAKKAAPIKQVIVAACILSKREDEIAALDQWFDKVLISLQLIDDWVDKYKDWEDGALTPVLKEILIFNQVDTLEALKSSEISRAAYFSQTLGKVKDIVIENTTYLKENNHWEIKNAFIFHDMIYEDICRIERENIQKREKVLLGGFSNILEKSIEDSSN